MTPVGIVHSTRKTIIDDNWDSESAHIVIDQKFSDSLRGLSEFSHAEIIFYMNQVDPRDTELSSRHPRNNPNWPKVGIFAQRGKNRPNAIGLSVCEIIRVDGQNLFVKGLDAIDGTPVLDIKPWMTEFGPRGSVRQPTWSTELMRSYWQEPSRSYSFLTLSSLEGNQIRLRPVLHDDLKDLARVLISPSTWFSSTRDLNSPEKFIKYFSPKIDAQSRGESLTLIAEAKITGEIVAMSTFQYPSLGFRKVEIGFTWVSDKWQRTFVNTEMKYLMLKHAFEDMKTSRVEFSVHPKNEKSNAAMRRLGAQFEGTLRKWRFFPGLIPDDGDRNIYSIIDDEWPTIRRRLEARLR